MSYIKLYAMAGELGHQGVELGSHLQSSVVIEEISEDQVCQNEKKRENSSTGLYIVLCNKKEGCERVLENDRETTKSFLIDEEDGGQIHRGSMEYENGMDNVVHDAEETLYDYCDFRDSDYEFDDDDDIIMRSLFTLTKKWVLSILGVVQVEVKVLS
ncbi:hypothetical protein PTKIN_Ptkin06aG0125800 [Pterospermum kingtungense]